MIFKENLIWLFAFLTVTAQCVTGEKFKIKTHKKPCDTEPSVDESFFIRHPFRKDVESTNNCSDKGTRYYSNGIRGCPKTPTVNGCPKYFKLNFNPKRRPQFITEAYCPCEYSPKNFLNICKTIYYYRNVIFKKKNGKEERRIRGFGVDCVEATSIAANSRNPPHAQE